MPFVFPKGSKGISEGPIFGDSESQMLGGGTWSLVKLLMVNKLLLPC